MNTECLINLLMESDYSSAFWRTSNTYMQSLSKSHTLIQVYPHERHVAKQSKKHLAHLAMSCDVIRNLKRQLT